MASIPHGIRGGGSGWGRGLIPQCCVLVCSPEPEGVRSPGAIRMLKAMQLHPDLPVSGQLPSHLKSLKGHWAARANGNGDKMGSRSGCSSKNKAGAGRGNGRPKAELGEAAWATRVRTESVPSSSELLTAAYNLWRPSAVATSPVSAPCAKSLSLSDPC